MNSTALRLLSRAEIQRLARREKIKANAKTDDIIRRLVDKYPDGVPRLATNEESPAKKQKAPYSGKPRKAKKVAASVNTRKTVIKPEPQEDNEVDDSEVDPSVLLAAAEAWKQVNGPSYNDIVYIMRELTPLINGLAMNLRPAICEDEIILKAAKEGLQELKTALKEVVWTGRLMEREFLGELKEDRRLWDGTGWLRGEDRERWEDFLERQRRDRDEKEKERERDREVQERMEDQEWERKEAEEAASSSSGEEGSTTKLTGKRKLESSGVETSPRESRKKRQR